MSDFGLSRSGRCVCVTFLSQYPISSFYQFYTLVFVPTTLQLCFTIVFPFHLLGSTFCLSTFHHPFLTFLALPPSLCIFFPTPKAPGCSFLSTSPFCCASMSANLFCNPD